MKKTKKSDLMTVTQEVLATLPVDKEADARVAKMLSEKSLPKEKWRRITGKTAKKPAEQLKEELKPILEELLESLAAEAMLTFFSRLQEPVEPCIPNKPLDSFSSEDTITKLTKQIQDLKLPQRSSEARARRLAVRAWNKTINNGQKAWSLRHQISSSAEEQVRTDTASPDTSSYWEIRLTSTNYTVVIAATAKAGAR